VRNPGGLWDTSMGIYPHVGGKPKESTLEWDFPSGAKVKFAHMEYDKDRFSWQGSQIVLICYDELTHFSWSQFIYMLSRNRSVCGVKPYIRATTNPDPDSWVRSFIDWWIDEDSGYAIPERSGKTRWFIVLNDETIWRDTKEEILKEYPESIPKSVSFISSTVFDNKILMEKDPGYIANLKALPRYEREQLLEGNWNIRPTAGMFFQRPYFEVVKFLPKIVESVRYWDRASTKETGTNDPDYTVGLKLEKDINGLFYISDIVRIRETPLKVQQAIKNTATQDGYNVRIGIEQDPGQAGVSEVDFLLRQLSGFNVKAYKASKDKVTRALPASSQAEAGNIKVLKNFWNEDFF
jgi:predicted phage terminase large subunit-like protein